ncbi:MAG: Rieske (2Fe-2S) protein [Thermoflexibacter sp.]|jgi:cytochrome b6-f complex iron-sulfur subunit|nr:Rieske (2Fe-2S) protein [Thermoflexibacter sp.]
MTRLEFLKNLGLSGASLFAVLATCTVQSCSSKGSDDPTPTPPPTGTTGVTGTTTGNNIDFTVDLANSANASLASTGGSLIFGDVIVVRNTATTFVALSKACTHQGTTVVFRPAQNNFLCNNHGSVFNLNGSVANGPAASPLKVFNTAVNGNNLRVTA